MAKKAKTEVLSVYEKRKAQLKKNGKWDKSTSVVVDGGRKMQAAYVELMNESFVQSGVYYVEITKKKADK